MNAAFNKLLLLLLGALVVEACRSMSMPSHMLAAQGNQTEITTSSPQPVGGDIACGPRCVQFILKTYGYDISLYDLFEEIMPQGSVDGSSLLSLANSFEKFGIYTKLIHLGDNTVPNWSYPVILHLNPTSNSSTIGHYVVLTHTTNDDEVTIWNGLTGIEYGSYADLQKRMSGNVLFTSPDPIVNLTDALRSPRPSGHVMWIMGSIIGLVCVFYIWNSWNNSKCSFLKSRPVSK